MTSPVVITIPKRKDNQNRIKKTSKDPNQNLQDLNHQDIATVPTLKVKGDIGDQVEEAKGFGSNQIRNLKKSIFQ